MVDIFSGSVHAYKGEESAHPKGKLKVFLGFAPGTGKTLAMLEDAYHRLVEGVDVVVGYVDVHGEFMTMQLLEKFETFPQRAIYGAGWTYYGMDLDAILQRRPKLVLVDHLARMNSPGLRHEARYLEVEELLNAGIDVYTTLNVYQIESQVDAVAYLTGAMVHETVPDRFLDEADQLQMVDLPPQELLERYKAGQISFPPRAESLMEKFFTPTNLFALRELAMKFVARRSNELMRSSLADRGFTDQESSTTRLMVCITPNPSSGRLIRAGRRMADETGGEWTVVYVETPEQFDLPVEDQTLLRQHLRLAELLGAKTDVVTGTSVAKAVRDYARKHHIHKVVVGRSTHRRWYELYARSLAEQLLKMEPSMNVYVVGEDTKPQRFRKPRSLPGITLIQILCSLVLVAVPTVLSLALTPSVISRSANLIMLYLLGVVIAAIFLGLVPALLTAVMSVLIFDYLFIPPLFRLFGFAPEYSITFISVLLVSVIVSTLVSRERSLSRAAQRRADQVTQLYEFSRDLARAVNMPEILDTIVQHISQTFGRDTVVLLHEQNQLVLSASSAAEALDTSELTAADWACQQGRPAGAHTGTFSFASYQYLPLLASRGTVGVVGVRFPPEGDDLDPERVRMLSAFVTKAAMSVERALFAEEASQTEILRATEKLQTALLNSISHDLRTPLASITGVLDSLRLEEAFLDRENRQELVETAYGEAERLNRLVGNLLDMTRLEAGTLRISQEPCDIQDVVGTALNSVAARLENHPVNVSIPPDLPLVPLDYVLVAQVLVNLLDNAIKYSPDHAPIDICARLAKQYVEIEVADRGPGIPEEDLERIFEKFYRVKRFENVVGTGLGLSICKGIVEVHGGKIWAENRPEGGGSFIFTLPVSPTPLTLQEPAVQTASKEK